MRLSNGMSATELGPVTWCKARTSNPHGNCVELALVGADRVAVRNSRDPQGPALVYERAEVAAFVRGAKSGGFDDLIG